MYGKENLLDDLHRARPASGFCAAPLVGPGIDHPHSVRLMVGRLPQRLVLSQQVLNPQSHVVDMVIVKLPVVSLQPVGVPPPVNVQSPVTDPLVSVIVLLPVCPVSDATPTNGPVSIS